MPFDAQFLLDLLQAGAATAASSVVEEATKDAYGALKTAIRTRFGGRPAEALTALEQNGRDATAAATLQEIQPRLIGDDLHALEPLARALAAALAAHSAAREQARTHGHVSIDVDSAGNISLARFSAGSLSLRAGSTGDITLTDFTTIGRPHEGN
jgi:hypothetical protein